MAEAEAELRLSVTREASKAEVFAVKAGSLVLVAIAAVCIIVAVILAISGDVPWAAGGVAVVPAVLLGLARLVAAAKGKPTPADSNNTPPQQ